MILYHFSTPYSNLKPTHWDFKNILWSHYQDANPVHNIPLVNDFTTGASSINLLHVCIYLSTQVDLRLTCYMCVFVCLPRWIWDWLATCVYLSVYPGGSPETDLLHVCICLSTQVDLRLTCYMCVFVCLPRWIWDWLATCVYLSVYPGGSETDLLHVCICLSTQVDLRLTCYMCVFVCLPRWIWDWLATCVYLSVYPGGSPETDLLHVCICLSTQVDLRLTCYMCVFVCLPRWISWDCGCPPSSPRWRSSRSMASRAERRRRSSFPSLEATSKVL